MLKKDDIIRLMIKTDFKFGMLDCKMALIKNNGNLEKSILYLKEKIESSRLITVRPIVSKCCDSEVSRGTKTLEDHLNFYCKNCKEKVVFK